MNIEVKRRTCHPDVLMQVLSLLKSKMPNGIDVTAEDWNKAYDIVWATNALETLEWKTEHLRG